MSFRRALEVEHLWPGEMKGLILSQTKVLLLNLRGTIYAYEDRCAHQAVELSKGRLEGSMLTCSAHEWQYDATTGSGCNPANVELRRFPVKVEGQEIWVDIDESAE